MMRLSMQMHQRRPSTSAWCLCPSFTWSVVTFEGVDACLMRVDPSDFDEFVNCMQVWIGYNQSLRPCQSGLTLNTDITAAAFLEGQPMLQLIGGTVGMMDISRGLSPQQVRSINKAVRGVQVTNLLLNTSSLPVSHISKHFCALAHCNMRTVKVCYSWKWTDFAAH